MSNHNLVLMRIEAAKEILSHNPTSIKEYDKFAKISKYQKIATDFSSVLDLSTYLICYPEFAEITKENIDLLKSISRLSEDLAVIEVNKFDQLHIVAKRDINKGEIVVSLDDNGIFTDERELRTIELNHDKHVLHYHGGLTNHHCNPTCVVDKYNQAIVAVRNILKGEEINFDYMINESEISSSFKCLCGDINCRGVISTEHSTPTYLHVA